MPSAIFILIACALIGEALRGAVHLPVPGPVIGMFLLAGALIAGARRMPAATSLRASLDRTAETLISHMGLLFVPAGVGIIAQADLLRQEWLPILAAVIGSTVLSLIVTALVMQRLGQRVETGGKTDQPAAPSPKQEARP